ncbi:MAG: hypothetical protein J6S75_02820, partial [Thermoguttaceae bacterium]|nr:hypothetical protein [Thermoguttaceae bacterium]
AQGVAVERLARNHLRRVAHRSDVDFERRPRRDGRLGTGPPSYADDIFQKGIDRVERPAVGMPREDKRITDRLENNPVLPDRRLVLRAGVGKKGFRQRARPDDQKLLFVCDLVFRDDRKRRAGDLA